MRLLFSLLLLASFAVCPSYGKKPSPADKKATKETVNLYRSLNNLQNKGVMYGHQDDLMYGSNWWYEKDRSDTRDFTGGYPGDDVIDMLSLDMYDRGEKFGGELDNALNFYKSPRTLFLKEIQEVDVYKQK